MSIVYQLPPVSNELEVPYVDLSRGVPLEEHLRRIDEVGHAAEELGWTRARRYYDHQLKIRAGELEREIRARVTADLRADREQNRLAWVIVVLLVAVVVLAIAAMVTG